MIDAYTIGITLALEDGVSEGIDAIRRDLAALDTAIAATAAQLLMLRNLATELPLPVESQQIVRRASLSARPAPEKQAAQPPVATAGVTAIGLSAAPSSSPASSPPLIAAPPGTEAPSPPHRAAAPAASLPPPAIARPVVSVLPVQAPSAAMAPPAVQPAPPTPQAVATSVVQPAPAAPIGAPPATVQAPSAAMVPPAVQPAPPTPTAAPISVVQPAPAAPTGAPPATAQHAPTAPIAAPVPAAPMRPPNVSQPPPQPESRNGGTAALDFAAIARALAPPVSAPTAATPQQPERLATSAASPAGPSPIIMRVPPLAPLPRDTPQRPDAASPPTSAPIPLPARSDAPVSASAPRQSAAPVIAVPMPPVTSSVATREPDRSAPETELADTQKTDRPASAEMHLDGAVLGRWVTRHLERQVTRPQAGATGFDPRMTPSWSGAPIGN